MMGRKSGSKNQQEGVSKSLLKRLFWGMGAAVLSYIVVPRMRKMAKPVVHRGMEGMRGLADKGKQALEEYKFRYKGPEVEQVMPDLSLEQMKVERDNLSRIMQQMQDRMAILQREIENLTDRS
jgi:hypothetical protein